MVPWIDIINCWGFKISYVEKSRMWTGGWSAGFSYKRFHIGMGVNPKVRDDYELS